MIITAFIKNINIEYTALINLIVSGAFNQKTEILIHDERGIWSWNKKTNYSPATQIFILQEER